MAPGNTNNIVKQLLFDPISTGADRLCIISYQATPSMASWLLKTFEEYGISDITVELIIGSTIKEGICQRKLKKQARNTSAGTVWRLA